MKMLNDNPDSYDGSEETAFFHYQQGSFRKRETKSYADLATGENQPKKGLLRVLVQTKGNKIMLIVMLMAVALTLAIGLLTKHSNENRANGIYFVLSSFAFEDKVYSTLEMRLPGNYEKKTVKYTDLFKKQKIEDSPEITLPENKIVHVQWQFVNVEGEVAEIQETTGVFNGHREQLRMVVTDDDIKSVQCNVSSGESQIQLKAPVKKN